MSACADHVIRKRILFTTCNVPSHLRALVPIAHAAQLAGHTVAVACAPVMSTEVESYGLNHLAAGPDVFAMLPAILEESGLRFDEFATMDRITEVLGGPIALEMAKQVIGASWSPDIIVRASLEFGGALAAEVIGVPHASVFIGGATSVIAEPARLAAAMAPHRAALGLPPDPDGTANLRYLNACLMPESFDPAELTLPNTRCYRHSNPIRNDELLPGALAQLPPDKPWIYASLGTLAALVAGGDHSLLTAVVAALGSLDCGAVVATGRGVPPGALGPVPGNVLLADHLPQTLLLECCDLFVTHAGHNSVREAMRAGVPLVCIPTFSEQPHNAQRCVDAGVAEMVMPRDATAQAIAAVCRDVLTEPRYRTRAREMRRAMLGLPAHDALVRDLEALVVKDSVRTRVLSG